MALTPNNGAGEDPLTPDNGGTRPGLTPPGGGVGISPAPPELGAGGACIRPAQREDLPAVVRLWALLQENNVAHDARLAPAPDAADWFLDFLRGEMDNRSAALFVAEGDGQIVGYVFGQILRRPTLANGDCGYVADLFVQDAWRGQGVGRRLYFALRDWFHARDLTAIELQIVRANPASQAFWRKMGFTDFLRTLRSDT